MEHCILGGLFLSLVLVIDTELADIPYVILLFTFTLIGFGFALKLSQSIPLGFKLEPSTKNFGPVDRALSVSLTWLWTLIILSWVIGVFIGGINGVDARHIFRNFFGLVIFLIFPVLLLVSPSIKSLMTMVYLAGIVQMFYGFSRTFDSAHDLSGLLIGSSISDLRSIYSTGFIVIFPLFTIGMAYQLLPQRYLTNDYGRILRWLPNSVMFTLLTLNALVVPAMSKGFILASAILMLTVAFFSVIYAVKSKTVPSRLIAALILVLTLLYFLPTPIQEVVLNSFGTEEQSNLIRSEQYQYLVSEFTLFGNGLGAPLASGYSRDDSGYGFELTYLNIIHKLGIFSVFLFACYAITLAVSFMRLAKGTYAFESFFALGSMGYLIVGAGNPLLLSSTAVILQCIAMYITVKPYIRPLTKLVR